MKRKKLVMLLLSVMVAFSLSISVAMINVTAEATPVTINVLSGGVTDNGTVAPTANVSFVACTDTGHEYDVMQIVNASWVTGRFILNSAVDVSTAVSESGVFKFDYKTESVTWIGVLPFNNVGGGQLHGASTGKSLTADNTWHTLEINLSEMSTTLSWDSWGAGNGAPYSEDGLDWTAIAGIGFGFGTGTVQFDNICFVYTPTLVIDSIDITTDPVVSSEQYSALAFSSLGQIQVNYTNGTNGTVDITADMISGIDTTLSTAQTATVTYGGKTDTFSVTLAASTIITDNSKLTEVGTHRILMVFNGVGYGTTCEYMSTELYDDGLGHDVVKFTSQGSWSGERYVLGSNVDISTAVANGGQLVIKYKTEGGGNLAVWEKLPSGEFHRSQTGWIGVISDYTEVRYNLSDIVGGTNGWTLAAKTSWNNDKSDFTLANFCGIGFFGDATHISYVDYAYIEYSVNVVTDKASIRMDDDFSGLRVLTTLSKSYYDGLVADSTVQSVDVGTLMIPKTTLGENTLDLNTTNVLNIAKTMWYSENNLVYTFTGVLTGIPSTEYGRVMVSRAYITITYNDTTVSTIYGDTYETSVNAIATLAYEDRQASEGGIYVNYIEADSNWSPYTVEQLAILANIKG